MRSGSGLERLEQKSELYGHMGEDEFLDMEVSDALAFIIDSISFPYEN
jgi:hypothetical protein